MMNIQREIRENIAVITLANPPGNELDQPVFMDVEMLKQTAEAEEVNGIILKGAGRHFSQGARLDSIFEMASDKEFLIEQMDQGKALLNSIAGLNIPVLAQITGLCFGGGLEIALACHLRICSDNALFAFPEVNHNLIPGLGGTVRLVETLGSSKALSVLLSGDTMDAAEALKTGLVDHCKPKQELDDFSFSLMKRMVSGKPRQVVTSLMQAWHNSKQMNFRDALAEETHLFYQLALAELRRRENQLT
jgi:enoyl-CoA hydratase/carnithine racemase